MKYLLPLIAALFLTACDGHPRTGLYSPEYLAYAEPYVFSNVYGSMLEGCKTRETTAALIQEMTNNFCN